MSKEVYSQMMWFIPPTVNPLSYIAKKTPKGYTFNWDTGKVEKIKTPTEQMRENIRRNWPW